MQTFLPYDDVVKTMKCLDYQRLGKQRVEAMQIMKALKQGPKVIRCYDPKQLPAGRKYIHIYNYFPDKLSKYEKYVKTPWFNHPATKMWRDNLDALAYYHNACIDEWIARGYNNNMLHIKHKKKFKMPSWFGNKVFHAKHRGTLLSKNKKWYSQFKWKEKAVYDYYWPI